MVSKMATILARTENRPKLPKTSRKMLANGFLTLYEIVPEDFGIFPKGPKSADFDQKAWAIAHGFDHGGFW